MFEPPLAELDEDVVVVVETPLVDGGVVVELVVDDVVELVVVLEVVLLVVEDDVDVEVLEEELDDELELVEEVEGLYTKVVVILAVSPFPPQVAFTVYVPATQDAVPPVTVVPL